MATGNFTLYNTGKLALLNGTVDLDGDNIVVALVVAGYTPNVAHDTWSDVSSQECADADYNQQALSSVTLTQSGGTVTWDCADISFGTTVSITAKYAVFVRGTTGSLAASDPLIGYVDLETDGGAVSSTNSVFALNTPSGLLAAA